MNSLLRILPEKLFLYIFICLILISDFTFSQKNNFFNEDVKHFTFSFDNDVYFNTDRYYTNGFYFSLMSRKTNFSHVEKILFPFAFGNRFQTFTLFQKIYTPSDFSSDEIKYGDRPFAANLELQYLLRNYSVENKFILTEAVSAGVVGKYAYGEEVQNGIHSLLPHSSDVPGWENQISGGVLFNYFMKIEKNIFKKNKFLFNISTLGKFGAPQTSVGIGAHFVVNSTGEYFDKPFYTSRKIFDFQIDFSAQTFYKLYDVNLQGNILFDSSPYVLSTIRHFLIKADSGIKLKAGKFTFELRTYYLSSEFIGGTNHLWGRFNIGYLF